MDSDDTRVMIASLAQLGLDVKQDAAARSVEITGCNGHLPVLQAEIFAANSGTTLRFLTAMLAAVGGRFRLDGTPRMRERPISPLIDALGQLGIDARSETGSGCPPVVIESEGFGGGGAEIDAEISSQYLSGLLMAAPVASGAVELAVRGRLVSEPYIEMTLAVMRAFGARVENEGGRLYRVAAPQTYRACLYKIEPDASAASYFFAAAAVTGGRITVEGLSRDSLQGDVAFCDCLERMGCRVDYGGEEITVTGGPLRSIDVDMNAISDTVQTLAAVALFAEGTTCIRNVGHIRHKETDRLAALAVELRKLGATVEEGPDSLKITPGRLQGATIDTYDDHRMAMSMAVAGLVQAGVAIRDPGCTAKTYPGFFADIAALAGQGKGR